MGNFGFGEMAVIAIFGLLVFGPNRLPEIARSVGGFIREFKNISNGITKEFKAEMDAAPVAKKAAPKAADSSPAVVTPPAPAPLITLTDEMDPVEASTLKVAAENVTSN